MSEESSGAPAESSREVIDAFLSQPALHADDDLARSETTTVPTVHVSWRRAVVDFLFNKKPSAYSSLAPRDAQGRRTKPFSFNGNGRGR